MRGKHANAARNRRDRSDLEQRAEKAERRAGRLERELADLRESSHRRIESLRNDVRQAIKDRDAAASPLLAQAEERIRELMAARDRAVEEQKGIQERWNNLANNWVDVLRGAGFKNTDAMEALMAAINPVAEVRTANFYAHNKAMDSPEKVLALDRAKGHRRAHDPLEDLRLADDA